MKTLARNRERRRNLMGINTRNLRCIYPYNPRGSFPNVDDKLRCKELLAACGVPVPETYLAIRSGRGLRSWQDRLADYSEFVIKPNRSYGGLGIILVRCREGRYYVSGEEWTAGEVAFHVAGIVFGTYSKEGVSDIAFFERMLTNHAFLHELIPPDVGGVADVRLICRDTEPIMAMLRIPTRESGGRANLHQGGIGIGIGIDSGVTRFGCYKTSVVRQHPDTGLPLWGHTIPCWEQMLQYGKRIAAIVGLGFVGVDFVVDATAGPVVLEVNARPGLNIQIANQQGLRGIFAALDTPEAASS